MNKNFPIIIIAIIAVIFFVLVFNQFGWLFPLPWWSDAEKTCNKLPRGGFDATPRTDCYMQQAVATKDTKICLLDFRITGLSIDRCYSNIAEENKDAGICDQVRDIESVKNRFINFTGKNDQSFYETALASCYIGVAEATSNFLICERIPYHDEKIRCYQYKEGATSAICEQMISGDNEKLCQCYFDHTSSDYCWGGE